MSLMKTGPFAHFYCGSDCVETMTDPRAESEAALMSAAWDMVSKFVGDSISIVQDGSLEEKEIAVRAAYRAGVAAELQAALDARPAAFAYMENRIEELRREP